ncbi:MAG: tRNA (adenosine(37)-N6)-threonylcarbamoyltransferase complex transferase subunit TsaD [Clostridiales bacterium]|nr:tRNA (adenosine(37)-N6)-threonylcarbamoyltransferase complex transferase subunit TsaD [Clostridiales bacterium]
MKDIIILAIETSCDETSVAIIKNGREILSNVIYTQIDIHKKFGGVVPEIASRKHIEKIDLIFAQSLEESGLNFNDLDAIAVTYGPGLVGALLVGMSYAKALAFGLGIPLIPVNHIDGHIAANYLAFPDLKPPYIALIVSGGHTHIVDVLDYGEYKVLGRTRDDAVGEAFDKVARTLGFPYPGGPYIDNAAKDGNKEAIKFPRTYLEKGSFDFSFSGIKSSVLNYLNSMKMKGIEVNANDVAASFQEAVVDVLIEKIISASLKMNHKEIIIAGGVAANSNLRKRLKEEAKIRHLDVFYPPLSLCTDNAAMIGAAAYYQFKKGIFANLDLNSVPNLKL